MYEIGAYPKCQICYTWGRRNLLQDKYIYKYVSILYVDCRMQIKLCVCAHISLQYIGKYQPHYMLFMLKTTNHCRD